MIFILFFTFEAMRQPEIFPEQDKISISGNGGGTDGDADSSGSKYAKSGLNALTSK